MQECLDQIKVLIAANNDATILTSLETQLIAICDKILAGQVVQESILAELLAICDKMLTSQESLEELCLKIEQGNDQSLQCFVQMKASLDSIDDVLSAVKVEKTVGGALVGANYQGALCYINGRPAASSPWAWIDNSNPDNPVTVASGANLNEFTEAVEALGYSEWSSGERHYICPCPASFTEAGSHFFTVGGETASKPECTPIEGLEGAPEKVVADAEAVCAIRTTGCNDDRRDDALQALLDKFCGIQIECCIAEGALEVKSNCQSYRDEEEVGDGKESTTYSVGLGSPTVWVDLPNPNTDEDVIETLNGICGDWQIVNDPVTGRRTLCNSDLTCGAARFRVCGSRSLEPGGPLIGSLFCAVSAGAVSVVEPTLECKSALSTLGCYEKQTADNVQNIRSDIADLLACPKPLPLECVKKRTFKVGYDNGFTAGSSSNNCGQRADLLRFDWPFEVVGWEVNGSQVGAGQPLGPWAGWTPQLQGWADFMNEFDPNYVESQCEAAFGFAPARTWRFTEITCCKPTAKYGPLKVKRTDIDCEYLIYPVLTSSTVETAFRYATLNCEGEKEIIWCDSEGNPTEAPEDADCYVPCGYVFDDFTYGPSIDCEETVYNVCDNVTTPSTPFVSVHVVCDGIRKIENYTLDSFTTAESVDDLVSYEVQGQIVDCVTDEPFTFPLSLDEELLEKACAQLQEDELQSAKLCLMEDHLNPAAPCPAEVPSEGLDKEAQTLTLKGDVRLGYPSGQSINLMNANGESCGEATSTGESTYDAELGLTVVTIEECDLDEGKEPAQVTQAKPQPALVAAAIKTVKAITLKRAPVAVKQSVPTRG